jgi:hypothetical protein
VKNQQKGFGLLGIIFIILILVIIGFAGWYLWKKQDSNSSKDTNTSQKGDKSTDDAAKTDPTDDWAAYSNTPGEFSFKHPKSWVFAENPEWCTETLVLFAPSASTVGKCATESFGQMVVMSTEGDARAESGLGEGFESVVQITVTADGMEGTKQTGTSTSTDGVGALPAGSVVTQYVFFTNGRTYTARYVQAPDYPNALSDFNTLVTKTLKFSAS